MNNTVINIREVTSKKDLKQFIKLPFKIHRNHPQWLPPILEDEWKVFDKKKNLAFDHCDTILLLAEKNGVAMGRIMGIINHVYNENKNEKNGRFCYLECYEDYTVFHSLLMAVENWAVGKGMSHLVGPIGFSDKDPQGFLLEGFEDSMTVMITNHSYAYMIDFIKKANYSGKLDLVQYKLPINEPLPPVYNKIAERVLSRGYRIKEFKSTRKIRSHVVPVFNLINETYKHIYGFAALTDEEAKEFSNRFLPILNPNFVKLIYDEQDELVAFVVAMPDMSKGLRKSKGRLYPFGFLRILWSMKKTKQLNLLLGSIKESKRNRGLDTVLAVKMFDSAQKNGFKMIDTHLIMESNLKMRAEVERLGAKMYKKYRIFSKQLLRDSTQIQ